MMDPSSYSPAILVVDDEPDMLTLLKIFLHDLAPTYRIVTVSDGPSALRQLADYTVPLMITDYMMPGMNGLQLSAAVKAASPTTQVIMITAYGAAELEQRRPNQPIVRFLAKEGMFDQLEDIVRSVLPLAPPT